MKYSIVPDSCRVCLQKHKKLRSIYQPLEEGEEPPNEMLRQLTGVTIDLKIETQQEAEADLQMFPNSICRNCELSLNLAFQFRLKAIKSQRIIEVYRLKCMLGKTHDADKINDEDEILIEENFDISKEQLKVEVLEMPYSEEEIISNEDDDTLYKDNLVDNPQCIIESHEQHTQGVCKDVLEISSDVSNSSIHDLKCSERRKTKSNTESRQSNGIARIKSKSNVEHTQKIVSLSKRGRPVKRVKDEHNHICDICGNIYSQRGRMMEHRRRHNQELIYSCELCDARFQHREKLRKHMYAHSGSKPYKCSYCSRSFYYESLRKAHEAIHDGHKPYICDVCSKAFAYSHALKKHKLIHADIKLYHCEYCDKDFRLQHHMKQHEETKSHQNAVQHAKQEQTI